MTPEEVRSKRITYQQIRDAIVRADYSYADARHAYLKHLLDVSDTETANILSGVVSVPDGSMTVEELVATTFRFPRGCEPGKMQFLSEVTELTTTQLALMWHHVEITLTPLGVDCAARAPHSLRFDDYSRMYARVLQTLGVQVITTADGYRYPGGAPAQHRFVFRVSGKPSHPAARWTAEYRYQDMTYQWDHSRVGRWHVTVKEVGTALEYNTEARRRRRIVSGAGLTANTSATITFNDNTFSAQSVAFRLSEAADNINRIIGHVERLRRQQ